MELLGEYYYELYTAKTSFNEDSVQAIERLPQFKELEDFEKMHKVLDSICCGRAPGKDGSAAEVL